MKTFVYTTFSKEGYHRFPEAATDPRYATNDEYDVSHLGVRHHHYFIFRVWVEVKHANRDIEFQQLKRWLESLYDDKQLEIDYKSCEMLAIDLANKIREKYGQVDIRIDIAEDGFNGALVEFPADQPIGTY